MIDFHTHTIFSDGELIASELVRRASIIGYRGIGLTDHVDASNLDLVLPRIIKVAESLNRHQKTIVMPGVEITHVPPSQIQELVTYARELGAVLLVVHGESPVEPVATGTNMAAIEAGVDILAHPGFISAEEAESAAQKGVYLEITSRSGHSLTNGHVARMAYETGAKLVIDTDTHSPGNLISRDTAKRILTGAGLIPSRVDEVLDNNEQLFNTIKLRLKL